MKGNRIVANFAGIPEEINPVVAMKFVDDLINEIRTNKFRSDVRIYDETGKVDILTISKNLLAQITDSQECDPASISDIGAIRSTLVLLTYALINMESQTNKSTIPQEDFKHITIEDEDDFDDDDFEDDDDIFDDDGEFDDFEDGDDTDFDE